MIQPTRIHVRFSDLDVLGHVNNSIYLSYFEIARVHYFAELLGRTWDWSENTVVLVKNEVEYIKPVLLSDAPYVKLIVDEIGTKSFKLSYELTVGEELRTKGASILVAYNGKEQTTMPIHPEMKAALEELRREQ
jgi:acyl-CoA thioester hydrolase